MSERESVCVKIITLTIREFVDSTKQEFITSMITSKSVSCDRRRMLKIVTSVLYFSSIVCSVFK